MVVDKVKRYLKGESSFTVKGGFADEFLKECTRQKAVLKNVTVQGNRVSGQVGRRSRDAVILAAQHTGMVIENETKSGLFYVFERYKNRVGIPIGLFMAVLILKLLSSMLWSVEVQGLRTIKEEDLMRYLSDMNVRKGTLLLRVECNEIEEMIERYSPYVKQAAVNLAGCRMYIEVHERELPPEIDGTDRYCNVVAAKDGEVLKADILAGVGNLKPGDVLQKGDMIAAGVMELKTGGVRYLEAKASVIAKTDYVFTADVARGASVEKTVKSQDRYYLYFFGVVLPRMKTENANVRWLSAGETVFPVGVLRQRKARFSQSDEELQFAQARLLALDRVAVAAVNGLKNKTVLSCTVSTFYEDALRVETRFTCEEDIAVQQFFEVIN